MSKPPFVPGMLVTKKHYTSGQESFNFAMVLTGLILFLGFVALIEYIAPVSQNACVPISETACVKEILTENSPKRSDLLTLSGLFVLLWFGFCYIISLINCSKYQIQINTQEEYDKEYPKKMERREREMMIINELKSLRELFESKVKTGVKK